jgi:large subunit ribosomal protein L5
MNRVRERYLKDVVPALKKEFGYANVMAIPKVSKVVINMGLGEATSNAKIVDVASDELSRIAGQKATVRRAKKSIAAFKVREGMPVGARVTLRGARMWEFLDRLISIALPRIRDFRGLDPRAMDGRGNFSLGIREQLIFPEIDYDSIAGIRGLDVAITTSAADDEQGLALLRALGMPFTRPEPDEGENQ